MCVEPGGRVVGAGTRVGKAGIMGVDWGGVWWVPWPVGTATQGRGLAETVPEGILILPKQQDPAYLHPQFRHYHQ